MSFEYITANYFKLAIQIMDKNLASKIPLWIFNINYDDEIEPITKGLEFEEIHSLFKSLLEVEK